MHPEIQRQIDDVRAGRSTTLSFEGYGSELTELPRAVRQLAGLRTLSLGEARLKRFPSWLAELPNLEEIDISSAWIMEPLPALPDVDWKANAQQVLDFGNHLDPGKVSALEIYAETSPQAIQHVFDLGRSGALKLSRFYVDTAIVHGTGPEQWKKKWPHFDVINSRLDEFLGKPARTSPSCAIRDSNQKNTRINTPNAGLDCT